MSSMWPLERIGMTIWGATCALGAVLMVILRQRPNSGLWLLYTQYLVTHVIFSVISVTQREIPGYRVTVTDNDNTTDNNSTRNSSSVQNNNSMGGVNVPLILGYVTNLLLLFAASVYFRIAVVICVRRRPPYHFYLTITVWITLLAVSVCITIMTFAVGLAQLTALVVFGYYFLCALYFLIMVYVVYVQLLRGSIERQYGRPVYPVVVSCVGKPSMYVLLGVIGGTIGMLDYLLVMVATFGVPIWEASFLSRLLDCNFYVPLAIMFLMWMDCPENFPMKDSTSYVL